MQEADEQDLSLPGQIARALGERIVTGVLKPGEPVRQDRIAAEFRTSHVPVREAFRQLEAHGYLVSAPRRGVRVAPLDPASVMEATEMRAALEALALRHAFPQLIEDDLAASEAAIAEGETSSELAVWERANRRFHRALIAPCGLPRLMRTIDELHRASARLLLSTWTELDWQRRSDDEHRAILSAVRNGDPDRATELLQEHILAAGRALAALLEPNGG